MCKAKRAVILLLSAMLVLGGCASGTAEMRQISVKITRSLTMQVSEKDAMVREEAERFAARVSELSGGMLEIEVQSGFPDHETVASGEADFAFLSNIQMAQANSLFGKMCIRDSAWTGRNGRFVLVQQKIKCKKSQNCVLVVQFCDFLCLAALLCWN